MMPALIMLFVVVRELRQTYDGNVWVVRSKSDDQLLCRVRVSSAPRQLCQLALPASVNSSLAGNNHGAVLELGPEPDIRIPSCYTKVFMSRAGLPVVGFPQTTDLALCAAVDVVDHMLEAVSSAAIPITAHCEESSYREMHADVLRRLTIGALTMFVQECPAALVQRLRVNLCRVAIIARDQVTTDILEHSHLKGSIVDDGRDWDKQVRGLGGTLLCPTCSVGEENVLRCKIDTYRLESILVHEFAHTVMEVGFDKRLHNAIEKLYRQSKTKYTPGIYMVVDQKEYWAEGSQSWFNASRRSDVNDGINTREKLTKHDPGLARLCRTVYGNGPWRYDFAINFDHPCCTNRPLSKATTPPAAK
eukprot:SM000079S22443  [mRNA]  locus=s79:239580:241334:- [translate_table: standard]